MAATEGRIRVMTVDDHPILREGSAAIIDTQDDMVLAGEAPNGRESVEQYRALRPDVTLMDIQMPEMDGIEAIRVIRGEFPDVRIVVLTTYDGDVQALRALQAGASGYLLRSMLRKELLDVIRAVHGGHRRVPAEVAVAMADITPTIS